MKVNSGMAMPRKLTDTSSSKCINTHLVSDTNRLMQLVHMSNCGIKYVVIMAEFSSHSNRFNLILNERVFYEIRLSVRK